MKINRIIFVICLFIAGCEENKVTPDIDTGLSGRDLPTQESWNSKVVFSEDEPINS